MTSYYKTLSVMLAQAENTWVWLHKRTHHCGIEWLTDYSLPTRWTVLLETISLYCIKKEQSLQAATYSGTCSYHCKHAVRLKIIGNLDYPTGKSDCSIRDFGYKLMFFKQKTNVLHLSKQIHLSEHFLWFSWHTGGWIMEVLLYIPSIQYGTDA